MIQLSDAHRETIQAMLAASPLIPVITINHPETAVPLCRALYEGGISVLEITLRTEYGLQAIADVRKAIPQAWVGAGTVTGIDQYREVEAVGARFAITPGITQALLEFGLTSQVPLLPGISTVSELMTGYGLGYREFKFFPAEVAGGVAALKAFSGPFGDVSFCPTGGITRGTARDYLALGNVAAVGGSWLTPGDVVAAGDWERISEIARGSLSELD